MDNQMKTAVENADINNQVGEPNTDVMLTPESKLSLTQRFTNWSKASYLALALLATAPAMQSCDDKTVEPTEQTDSYAGMTQEQKMEAWHIEAEAYANDQKWSQGVKSLAAGELDNYYYKESANGPILVKISYKVDVNDFIKKIETDAANKGTYDPKTEGFYSTNLASLEGDNKNTAWYIPSSALYEAQSQGKSNLTLNIGDYPAQVTNFTTIAKNEGLNPNKQMQVYSFFGNKNWKESNELIGDKEKKGAIKDIL